MAGRGHQFDLDSGVSGTAGTTTSVSPEATPLSGAWSDFANTRDGDEATSGTETVTSGSESVVYEWGAGTRTGYARVVFRSQQNQARLIAEYSTDNDPGK